MAALDENLDAVEIGEDGALRTASKVAMRRLQAAAGRWRLLPPAGDLLILQRTDGERKGTTTLALCGEIDGPGALATILNFVHFSGWDGTLTVQVGAVKRALYFRGGQLQAATSNQPEDRLGAMLVRFGLLTEDDLASCIGEVTAQRRLGTVLVDKGVMSAAQLYDGIRRQTEEIFYSALIVRAGVFYFIKQVDEGVPSRLHLDTQGLLLDGMRRIDEMSYFRAKLSSPDVVLVRRRDPPADLELTVAAQAVFRMIDDQRRLGEISTLTHLGEFATTKAAFELLQAGLIEGRHDPELRRRRPVPSASLPADAVGLIIEAYNGALQQLNTTMSERGKSQALRQGVRAFLSGNVRFAELFRDVSLGDDGALPKRQLLLNIDGLPEGERLELLQRGMNELLFFMLFVAGDAIDRAEEQALHQHISKALATLPRSQESAMRRVPAAPPQSVELEMTADEPEER